ncbi:MAG TPA: MarR family transcriptional regulator [Erysipelothrix sp.]|nr:MarR family transcriptional regulator [Erysipelothrix sp.]
MNKPLTLETFFIGSNNLRMQMHGFIKAIAKKYDLRGQELIFLLAIDHYKDSTVGYLSKKLNVQQANVSKMVKSLEEQGYITKELDPDDIRSFTLNMTPKSFELKKQIRQSFSAQYEEHKDEIDLEVMIKGIEEMQKLIQIYEDIL